MNMQFGSIFATVLAFGFCLTAFVLGLLQIYILQGEVLRLKSSPQHQSSGL